MALRIIDMSRYREELGTGIQHRNPEDPASEGERHSFRQLSFAPNMRAAEVFLQARTRRLIRKLRGQYLLLAEAIWVIYSWQRQMMSLILSETVLENFYGKSNALCNDQKNYRWKYSAMTITQELQIECSRRVSNFV